MKASDSDTCSNSKSELDKGNDKGKKIIGVEFSDSVATTKIQNNEPKDS